MIMLFKKLQKFETTKSKKNRTHTHAGWLFFCFFFFKPKI